jgi:hypothetical protein
MLLASFLSGISSLSVFLSSNLFFFYGVADEIFMPKN